ncbi:hypothetical protein BC941DRAFT_432067 [Chlamydoabsidia padenii]|nr:hypothetical protein BC941DRAFT_432067 [Chlamydoabsidia padenii]
MLLQHYRVSKRRLALLIVVIVFLTWSLIIYSKQIYFIHRLPWYRHSHDPFNSTSYAWTTINNHQDMLQFAETKMRLALTQSYDGVIPGSGLADPAKVTRFRTQVACWTRQGSWQHHPTSSPLAHHHDPLYGHCDRVWKKHHEDIPRPATLYQWQPPSQCPLLSDTIQTKQWCDIFHGRHILLVGDLIHYQLHDLLLDALRDGPSVCYGELNCNDHTICPRPHKARLRYIRNDLLSHTTRLNLSNGEPTADVVEWPFLNKGTISSYKIILLNRSPVVDDDTMFVQHLVTTLAEIRRIQPDALILYRSSYVGHPYCDEANGPISSQDLSWQRQLPYGWSEYQRRNQLAQVLVELAGGVYLDMATSLDHRPDGHIGGSDCLRYCMPGPLDAWGLLFYNVFLALGLPSS